MKGLLKSHAWLCYYDYVSRTFFYNETYTFHNVIYRPSHTEQLLSTEAMAYTIG